MAWWQPKRELRAFDWVDYLLYLAATIWFAVPAASLLRTGKPPEFLPVQFGSSPSLYDQENQLFYSIIAALFVIFVTFVYLRNYIVMHAIDDRKEGEHLLFYFVDYNIGGWSRAERMTRAMIVLWVLTSAIGAVRPITFIIWETIESYISYTAGLAKFQILTFMQAFFAYYGFVIVILFLLFMLWDVVNIASIGRQIKKKSFDGRSLGPAGGFEIVARSRDSDFAVPKECARIIPIYSMVTYIQPRRRTRGDLGANGQETGYGEKIRKQVAEGRLLQVYFAFSHKFEERLTGLAIGALLLSTPLVENKSLPYLLVPILLALGAYIRTMLPNVGETIRDVFRYFFDFMTYAAPPWSDPARAAALGNGTGADQGAPDDGENGHDPE